MAWSPQAPRGHQVDRRREVFEPRPVQEGVTGLREDVVLKLDSRRQKLLRELVARSAHDIAVRIDHERGRETGEIMPSRESEPVSKSGLRSRVVPVHSIENPAGVRHPPVVAYPPSNFGRPWVHRMEESVSKDDAAQFQSRPQSTQRRRSS